MNDETNNEPKSLAEMTKEELLQAYDDTEWNDGSYPNSSAAAADYRGLRAELLRRMEAGEELAAPLEPKCPKCGGNDIHISTKQYKEVMLAGWMCKCGYVGDRVQFFTAKPQPVVTEPSGEIEARMDEWEIRAANRILTPTITGCERAEAVAYFAMIIRQEFAAEPHTLTREQILVKALEVLRDKWPQSHADFRGMTLIELLDYQRSLIAGLMADFVLSLSPSTRPSGEGWIKCSERLPEEDEPVLIAVRCEADDHGTEMTVTFPEVHRGTIYTAPNMVIAATDDGCEYENTVSGAQEILGWQQLPAPPTEEKGPSGEGS